METRKLPIVKPTAFGVSSSEITHGVDLNPPKLYLNSCRSDLYCIFLVIPFVFLQMHSMRCLKVTSISSPNIADR
jgi:hypothetical protein